MNAPHYEPTITLGNLLIMLGILSTSAAGFVFVWNISSDVATFQTSTERRLAEGEKVRMEKVPQLDAMAQTVGITNERLSVQARSLAELRDNDLAFLRELGAIRERLSVIETENKNRPRAEPFRP